MSIPVPIDELESRLAQFPWAYLATVRDDGRVHGLAVPTQYVDGALIATVGPGTSRNATARPEVTLLFPGPSGAEMSLIVDGTARVDGDRLEITPTWAVLHRPALAEE